MSEQERESEGATIVREQLMVDGCTVELEADIRRKHVGGADDDENAEWAGAGMQVTATAVTVQRGDEEDRLDLPSPSDPLKQSKAMFLLVPVLSLAAMAVVRTMHRRTRRALKRTG